MNMDTVLLTKAGGLPSHKFLNKVAIFKENYQSIKEVPPSSKLIWNYGRENMR